MTATPLTINIMAADIGPGDAIGNYVMTSARIWKSWGAKVEIYADHVAPVYGGIVKPTAWYHPSGDAILWYHYSIYAQSLEVVRESPDFKVMDFHGVAPPHLFAGDNDHLAQLCERGRALLPELSDTFDLGVIHSEFARDELLENGYSPDRLHKVPLCIDTARYIAGQSSGLAEQLAKLDYFLFVGRVIPQKDILALLEIFEQLQRRLPQTVLVLVGSRHLAGRYQRSIRRAIKKRKLENRVLFTGQVNNPALLAELYRNAKLLFVTSEWETFCVPLVEAMHFGTPPVAHHIRPLPEVMGSGGLVIDKSKPRQVAETVVTLLQDSERYQALCQAARDRSEAYTEKSLEKALLSMHRRWLNSE